MSHSPYLQRFFEKWLNLNRHRFLAIPYIETRRHDRILVGFVGYPKIIKAEFRKDLGINVMVMKKWQVFDYLAAGFNNFSVRSSSGVGGEVNCTECDATFRSIEDYFSQHIFEEFLIWTNEVFFGARYLLLEEWEGSMTARLSKTLPEDFKGDVIEMKKGKEQMGFFDRV